MQLLLIEDDAVIARELALHWRGQSRLVRHVESLSAASLALREPGTELIVLDLGLPDGDGLEWLGRLRRSDTTTPVMVLTARGDVSSRVAGLRTGADDYLVKPFAVEELDARLDVLTRRAGHAHSDAVHCGRLAWIGSEGRVYVDGRALELNRREFEVLGLLMRRAPRLVPKRVLVDTLAERNVEVGDAAVEVYVCRLRRKLAGSGTAIRTLRGFGYQLALDETGDA